MYYNIDIFTDLSFFDGVRTDENWNEVIAACSKYT